MWTIPCYVISAIWQAYKNAFTFDPLFLFEGAPTKGPATSSSSPAPCEISPLDPLRSTVAPTKSWLLFKLFGRSSFSSPESSSVSLSPSSLGVSNYSTASLTFINFLAAILYSYIMQTKELAYDAKVKKQTTNS